MSEGREHTFYRGHTLLHGFREVFPVRVSGRGNSFDRVVMLSIRGVGLRETASNAISWLNPADIETITVLKDASATAIYGTRATNVVIVMTTTEIYALSLHDALPICYADGKYGGRGEAAEGEILERKIARLNSRH